MNSEKEIVVAVSGGFDPLHLGHVQMFEEAKKLGTKLVVILNNDNWLITKKGFSFMPEKERAAIIKALSVVDDVVISKHTLGDSDRSVGRELERVRPHVFANGGDRKSESDIPEVMVCNRHNIKMAFNVGGGKIQSSSWLTNKAVKHHSIFTRPWGTYENIDRGNGWFLKIITIKPGSRLSLQNHAMRSETWTVAEGSIDVELKNSQDAPSAFTSLNAGQTLIIPHHMLHRVGSKNGAKIIELSTGEFNENDIVRYEDDYGRIQSTT